MKTVIAYIGIGSNVGNRALHIRTALKELSARGDIRVLQQSPVYLTTAVGPAQRSFLNAVVKVRTSLQPKKLLVRLKEIEHACGRRAGGPRWGPRVIDLDILFFGKTIRHSPDLCIPHPALASRRFVLEPLAALSPGLVHPLLRKTMRSLCDILRLTCLEQKVTIYSTKYGEK